ncbi:MAG: chromate transporter [Alphaproteobacteria bacterium]|nr:chromate transporter [Alphaproteobacteria bacterium]
MNDDGAIGTIARHFALLSLLTIGGVSSVLPAMHREAVEVQGWMTSQRFADLYAIAQATPGPNMMIVTLIGWHAAGIAGGLVATAALTVPSAVLTFLVLRLWDRFKTRPWRLAIQNGLTPVMVGLVSSSGLVLVRAVDTGYATFAITAATAAVSFATRINPLWVMGVAAALGMAGLL